MASTTGNGQGWRSGKPEEDPEKMKRWGVVAAKPSEFLVHVRNGRVLSSSSGQGASCFKWPWDAVAIVPTSLQRLTFKADQVTAERVGVEVVGLGVYRIAEPLLAYRVLNFSFPERAQQKLEETLTAMCIGAARRLIANLTVDECLQKRKAALADELIREIAPVLSGTGRPDDSTAQGWGVILDTIEIQEVRVLSESVFGAMQAPFRASLDKRAREAKLVAEKEIAEREAEHRRQIELARLSTEAALRERAAEEAKARAEQEARELRLRGELAMAQRMAELEAKRQLEQAELEASRVVSEQKLAIERAAMEAELESGALQARAVEQRARIERAELAIEVERRKARADITLVEGKAQAEVASAMGFAEQRKAEAEARVLMAKNLPQLASAVGQKIGEVRITQFGDQNPFASITQAVQAVIDLVHPPARSGLSRQGCLLSSAVPSGPAP